VKIQRIDGKYYKDRLRPGTVVPIVVWLPFLMVLFVTLALIEMRTGVLQNQPIAAQPILPTKTWRIAAVGDIACSPNEPNFNSGQGLADVCRMKDVGEALERENLDAVLLLGDIQYSTGTFEDFEKSFVPYFRDIKAPIYAVAGNHDYGNGTIAAGNLSGYRKAFDQYFPTATYQKESRTYYDFRLGSWQILALDSNCQYVGGCEVGSPQYEWLVSKLSPDIKCSLSFWHHPLFTSGIHRSDADVATRKDLWTALQRVHTDIVVSGHDHHYERFAPKRADGVISTDGVRSFVSGTGGHSLRTAIEPYANGQERLVDDQFGYLYIELFTGRYEWRFKSINGAVLDEGSAACH
jgi:acid phosphatase type 7